MVRAFGAVLRLDADIMLKVTESITLDEGELRFRFVRASGPGGQNVNKVATKVQLRFDAAHSESIPDEVRTRLLRLAGRRATSEGIVIIEANRFRSQERNREEAVQRLINLLRRASERPRSRKKTSPTSASRERRLEEKHRRGEIKRMRTQTGE